MERSQPKHPARSAWFQAGASGTNRANTNLADGGTLFHPMERQKGMFRKRRVVLTVLIALCLLPVALASPTQSSAMQQVGLVDGEWWGRLSYNALVVYDDDIPAHYYGRGSIHVEASGSSVGGSFIFNQLTVVRPPELPEAIANTHVFGTISGGTSVMEMAYESVRVTSTSAGVTADLTFTAAELGNPTISIVTTSGSCGSVSGFWNHEFAQGLIAQDEFIVGRQGTWSAHRSGGEGLALADYEAVMQPLEADVASVIEQIRADGPISVDLISDVLGRAEHLANNGLRRANCDSGADDTVFRNRAFAAITQLLQEVALSDGVFANAYLELMVAGHRSGVFALDEELGTYYDAAFEEIVDVTLREGSAEELLSLYSAARQLGKDELAAQIAEILEVVEP